MSLAVIILGRDIGLILASFVVRFISLPPPVSACIYILNKISWGKCYIMGIYEASINFQVTNIFSFMCQDSLSLK